MAENGPTWHGPTRGPISFHGNSAITDTKDLLFSYQKATLSSFVKVKGKRIETPARSDLVDIKKIYWQEFSSDALPLSYDGVPFMILGKEVWECCHGPDRHKSEKAKASRKKNARKVDHEYISQGRKLLQTTKKMDCPAAIHVRSVVRFPSYKTDHNSDWAKKRQAKALRSDLRDSNSDVVFIHYIYIALPDPSAHKNHLTDEVGAMTHNVDPRVIKKIHSLVAEGVRDVAEMRRHVTSFSKTNFAGVPETSNRFFPNNRCLRNHMYSALNLSQFSTEDQENLRHHVTKWTKEKTDDKFFFVPSPNESDSDGQEFIFVHQTAWQRRLLSLYGKEICLLDATYCVCKSEVALFFVCVSTNVGYMTVGCFLLPSETIKNISRGLSVLKEWNPDWAPSFFMTDYDEKEITAIETTFPGTNKMA